MGAAGKRLKYGEQDSLFGIEEVVPVPKTPWRTPHEFPDLSGAKAISFDVESYDPGLIEKGPGYQRGEAHIVGLAVGTDDGYRQYFPMRHELGGNLDPTMVLRWAQQELGRANQPKVGANLLYDIEALDHEGIIIRGDLIDVQIAEPLLNEHRRKYGLEYLAQDYLGEGKVQEGMYKWLAAAYGGNATRQTQASRMYKCPVALVGPYAESDVTLPFRIWEKQRQALIRDELLDLYRMEASLIPMLAAMRKRGIRVDVRRAELLNEEFIKRAAEDEKKLRTMIGYAVNVNAPDSFCKFLEQEGLSYPRTKPSKSYPNGQPSITKEWLEACPHPVSKLIGNVRKWDKFRSTFIEGYILNGHVNGRIHGQFHQLKTDENGTISGRFSSSNPNLENIPTRDETKIMMEGKEWKLGNLVRSLFLPDEDEDFCADDYSQIEYRVMTHYGTGPSAEKAQNLYRTDPTTDFHNMVSEMTGLNRKTCKNINFGKAYGFGKDKAASMLGCSVPQAIEFMNTYDEEMPFIKELNKAVSAVASSRGYIKTILNRRARFNLWESKDWDQSKVMGCMSRERAISMYGERGIRRAQTHKALNALAQGSAADVFKNAMAKCWAAGVFDDKALGPALNLVHDEVNTSRRRDKIAIEAHAEMVHLMKTSVKLCIPLLVDTEVGPSWGDLHDEPVNWQELEKKGRSYL